MIVSGVEEGEEYFEGAMEVTFQRCSAVMGIDLVGFPMMGENQNLLLPLVLREILETDFLESRCPVFFHSLLVLDHCHYSYFISLAEKHA